MKKIVQLFTPLLLLMLQLQACAQKNNYHNSKTFRQMNTTTATDKTHKEETATFGAGCYWCTEAQFQQLKGVRLVESGFSGGQVDNPTYREVCNGTTGHAEVCNIYYDPAIISFDELLAAFWTCHTQPSGK
jgi:peptide-methionine (S)-S-oxide reductase